MAREPEEDTKNKGKAHARAVRTILDRHRAEFNRVKQAEMAKEGFVWNPPLSPTEKAAKEANDRKATAIQRMQKIAESADIPMVVGLDPAQGAMGGLVVGITEAAGRGLQDHLSLSPEKKAALKEAVARAYKAWADTYSDVVQYVPPTDPAAVREQEAAVAELIANGVPPEVAPQVSEAIRRTLDGTAETVKVDWRSGTGYIPSFPNEYQGLTSEGHTPDAAETISRDDPRFIQYDPEKVVAKQEWHGDQYDIVVPEEKDAKQDDDPLMPEGTAEPVYLSEEDQEALAEIDTPEKWAAHKAAKGITGKVAIAKDDTPETKPKPRRIKDQPQA